MRERDGRAALWLRRVVARPLCGLAWSRGPLRDTTIVVLFVSHCLQLHLKSGSR